MPPPLIDLTREGDFRLPPRTSTSVHVLRIALMVAVAGGALVLGALALSLALLLVPVVIGAALIAWLTLRWRLGQARRHYAAASAQAPARNPASSDSSR